MSQPAKLFSVREKLAQYQRAITAEELADCLGKDAHTIRSLARKDALPSFRLGTSVMFDPKAVYESLSN